jgi:hypothetical protein
MEMKKLILLGAVAVAAVVAFRSYDQSAAPADAAKTAKTVAANAVSTAKPEAATTMASLAPAAKKSVVAAKPAGKKMARKAKRKVVKAEPIIVSTPHHKSNRYVFSTDTK